MIVGTNNILANKIGFRDQNCMHSFCRLIGKINTAHQLSEMTLNNAFKGWVQQVYEFTMDNLKNWQATHNSQHYLLNFWSQLVAPVIVLRENAPPSLEEYVRQVTLAYVDSRVLLAEASAKEELDDDPLEDEV